MTRPTLARTRAELDLALKETRTTGSRIALVPTMGALHPGHAALLAAARARLTGEDTVVASVFVNPLQFGAGEDLERYPRSLDADLRLCRDHAVDVVFAPAVEEIYPHGTPQVTPDPGPLGVVLEGGARPGHFRGVLTVVAKLFGIVRPELAVFGEKDYQQLVLVRRLAADLELGVDVVGVPTVREPDGLAMSSRNRYLDAAQRCVAPTLSAALRAGAGAQQAGPEAVRRAALAVLDAVPDLDVDYLELTSPDLGAPPRTGAARLLVAARLGTTRLIDNLPVVLGGS